MDVKSEVEVRVKIIMAINSINEEEFINMYLKHK